MQTLDMELFYPAGLEMEDFDWCVGLSYSLGRYGRYYERDAKIHQACQKKYSEYLRETRSL